jgi:hypothetical protein
MNEFLTLGNIAITLFVFRWILKIENRLTRIETVLNGGQHGERRLSKIEESDPQA